MLTRACYLLSRQEKTNACNSLHSCSGCFFVHWLQLAAGVVNMSNLMPGCLLDGNHVLKDGEFVPPSKAGMLAGFYCICQVKLRLFTWVV